jgi:phosphoglycolate phosphatase
VKLHDLLFCDEIVIQCHDNPDADAIASGFAVYAYCKSQGKNPRLVYAGRNRIRKTNLVMMIQDLKIPIEHVEQLEAPELLVMVDCQYEGGNTTVFAAKEVAVIDHHRVCTLLPELSKVDSRLGSCSTLVWKMLREEGCSIFHNRELSTALYYGLYSDTSAFTEISHPLDKDLRDTAEYDAQLLAKYRNSNLSLEELEVAGAALLKSDYKEEYRAAIVKSGPCDPNILGVISDLVLEVDAVDICIVFNVQPGGVKISVRSCSRTVKASEVAEALCENIGFGGGHVAKAGGYIQMDLLAQEYLRFCEEKGFTPRMEPDASGKHEQPAGSGIKAVLEQRFRAYMDDTDILHAGDSRLNVSNAQRFIRRPIAWGYIRTEELFAEGTCINIRSIHGDFQTVLQKDIILLFSPKGELYFRRKEEFLQQFHVHPDWAFALSESEYAPTIKNMETGEVFLPAEQAHVCVPNEERVIYARKLTRKVKLFPHDELGLEYQLGRIGDYLLDSSDSLNGVRIIKRDAFEQFYEPAEQAKEKKTVIFDLDGTLLDTLEDLKEAVNFALGKEQMPLCTLEQVRQYVGNGVRKLMIRAVPEGEDNPRFEEAFAAFTVYYKEHCLDNTRPYPGVMHLLEELKYLGVRTAIVSNKLDPAVKELHKRFFADTIEAAIGETAQIARKPAPDMVRCAMEQLSARPEQSIYVGDSEVDLQTAQNAGLPCVSVTWGFRDKAFLRGHGAKTFIQTPLELLNLL